MKINKKINKPNKYKYDFERSEFFFEQLKDIQKDISSQYKTNKIAITSISEDELAYKFALVLAQSYNSNEEKTLVVDANFYAFCAPHNEKEKVVKVEEVDVLRIEDENYPGDFFREGNLELSIKKYQKRYKHFIFLMPDVKQHKEIGLLGEFFDCSLLVVGKNKTKKEDIFNAVEYCKYKQLPIAKVIILK